MHHMLPCTALWHSATRSPQQLPQPATYSHAFSPKSIVHSSSDLCIIPSTRKSTLSPTLAMHVRTIAHPTVKNIAHVHTVSDQTPGLI
eukprot:2209894-Amphidinium_carterae.1